jgi:hypothetical protein
MNYGDYFNILFSRSIDNDVRKATDNKFPCTFHSAGAPNARISGQQGSLLPNEPDYFTSRLWVVLGNVIADFAKVPQRRSSPA